MKRLLLIFCLLAMMGIALALPGFAAHAEEADLPEWTVMLYMCGSDLESRHGLATYNLNDIASIWFPQWVTEKTGDTVDVATWESGQVNVVVQTGGSKAWHGMEPDEEGRTLGVDIATDRLQRYAFEMVCSPDEGVFVPVISLVDEQPLASMGRPETLSDFIRWTAREYPAQKYALVLWDHGGGSRTGIFVDELFDNDILYLYELGQALADGGARFELVAIDACLMCSMETACMIAPYANYMVASEEVAAGYGSAFADWLMEIYRNPGCDGAEVGCEICDATLRKYAKMDNTLEETQLTFSVIDLSLISDAAEAFDRLYEYAGMLYEQIPVRFNMFCNFLIYSEKYGLGGADMVDIGSFLYNTDAIGVLDSNIRNAMASALNKAVFYTVRGSGRSASEGLSFCVAPEMTPEEMDIYALNCPSPVYIALLDAVNADWVAPDWVYERTRRLTPVEEFDDYRMEWELTAFDGLPALRFKQRSASFLDCLFKLYRLDEDTGEIYLLGMSDTLADWDDEGNPCFVIDPPTTWPAIDGQPCTIELIDNAKGVFLYNVPIQLSTDPTNMRVRSTREYDEAAQKWVYKYQVLGLWDGYDKDTRMPSRAITSLYQVQGREYVLLYPCCGLDGLPDDYNLASVPLTMYRALDIYNEPLPEGTYYCGFQVRSVFGQKYDTALIEMTWDGNAFTLADR